jgi:hypothetical protein
MSTSELSGSWRYRSFNPKYGSATQEDELVLAEAVLTLRSSAQAGKLEGTIEWPGGGLDLDGTFVSSSEIFDYARFDIVGTGRPDSTGRPGTGTDGWEYRYHGHLSWQWAKGPDIQTPTLVGSVIRSKPHGVSRAGEVFSFIALKQQQPVGLGAWSLPWILEGSWNYRSFLNDPNPYLKTAPTADGLILQEAVLNLEIPTDTTALQGTTPVESGSVRGGTIELPGGVLNNIALSRIRSAEDPPEFAFSGTGSGGEHHYHGHLTRKWPNEASSSGVVSQLPALVGTVSTLTGYLDADRHLGPVYSVYPFIAVKQPPSR